MVAEESRSIRTTVQCQLSDAFRRMAKIDQNDCLPTKPINKMETIDIRNNAKKGKRMVKTDLKTEPMRLSWHRSLSVDPILDQAESRVANKRFGRPPLKLWENCPSDQSTGGDQSKWRAFLNRQPRLLFDVRLWQKRQLSKKLSTRAMVLTKKTTTISDPMNPKPGNPTDEPENDDGEKSIVQQSTDRSGTEMLLHSKPSKADVDLNHVDVQSRLSINIADQSEIRMSGAFHLTQPQSNRPVRIVFDTPRLMSVVGDKW